MEDDSSWFWESTDLEAFGDLIDARGRAWSPFIERAGGATPSSVSLPTPVEMRGMDASQLAETLSHYGMSPTPDVQVDLASQYLERFNITSTDPRWEREMERLTGDMERLPLLGAARRATERYETLVAADGELDKESVYLAEGADPCEECLELAGDVMTLRERIDSGAMPGDRCLGGTLCQCAVAIYE